MGTFDRQIATAQRLIKKYGQECTWKVANKAAGAHSWEPAAAADTDKTVNICFVAAKDRFVRQLFQALKGSEIQIGSLAGFMGEVDFEPSINDTVLRDGVLLSIESIDLLSPNGQKILYTIEFKG